MQHDGEDENLQKSMAASVKLRPEYRQRESSPVISGQEILSRRELKRDTRQMFGGFCYSERSAAGGGVMNVDPSPGHGLQHDEVAHVPVKDRWQSELVEVVQLESKRTAE